ncbi:MAG: futalosine hydrolase [Luteitalea sp.]|nr:futalosine hydrolase [Luteitalea sp.]
MRILLVTAVAMEAAPVLAHAGVPSATPSRLTRCSAAGHDVDVLLTGVGMVATAAWCSRAFTGHRYDLALNVGVCGSFDRALAPGDVVHVVRDRFSELGAEDGDRLLSMTELGLLDRDDRPFAREELVNPAPPRSQALEGLPAVSGITVNTVHGNERSIALVAERFGPQVESMEGAAFMYACMIHDLPFAQVRAVSNLVEKRNRDAWRMADAIERLGGVTVGVLESL